MEPPWPVLASSIKKWKNSHMSILIGASAISWSVVFQGSLYTSALLLRCNGVLWTGTALWGNQKWTTGFQEPVCRMGKADSRWHELPAPEAHHPSRPQITQVSLCCAFSVVTPIQCTTWQCPVMVAVSLASPYCMLQSCSSIISAYFFVAFCSD